MRKSKRNAMISTFVLTLLLIVGSITAGFASSVSSTDADLSGSAEAEAVSYTHLDVGAEIIGYSQHQFI